MKRWSIKPIVTRIANVSSLLAEALVLNDLFKVHSGQKEILIKTRISAALENSADISRWIFTERRCQNPARNLHVIDLGAFTNQLAISTITVTIDG